MQMEMSASMCEDLTVTLQQSFKEMQPDKFMSSQK